jgi:hypothetical protein
MGNSAGFHLREFTAAGSITDIFFFWVFSFDLFFEDWFVMGFGKPPAGRRRHIGSKKCYKFVIGVGGARD